MRVEGVETTKQPMQMRGLTTALVTILSVLFLGVASLGAGWAASVMFRESDLAREFSMPRIPLPNGTVLVPEGMRGAITPSTDTDFALFWEAMALLDQNFYAQDEVPNGDDITYAAIEGLIDSTGDPHSSFLTPDQAQAFSDSLNGEFEGIGARVDMSEEGLVIVAPFPGTPAEQAGLLPGDIVLQIDDTSTEGLSTDEAVALVRGPRGTTVTLTVLREGEPEPLVFEIERDRIVVPVVETRLIEEEGAPTIGYVRLTEFGANAGAQFQNSLEELQADGAEWMIVDMRFNPGGLLNVSVDVTSEFIDGGLILSERFADGSTIDHESQGDGVATSIPLVVLVNEGSASASEIFAGAIKDTERGTIIGTVTFGKGSVQRLHTLSDGSLLRMTVARWFTPTGNAIHEVGVEPDIVIEVDPATLTEENDPQLQAAIDYIKEQ